MDERQRGRPGSAESREWRGLQVDETGLSPEWAVPWSDLMMVMFVLFAALFIYKSAERDLVETRQPQLREPRMGAVGPAGEPCPPSPEVIYEQSEAVVRQTDLENVRVDLNKDRSVQLSLDGSMFFELGKADLLPQTKTFLDKVGRILHGNRYEVRVVGHTDSFPVNSEQFPTNWELSAVRATTVTRYLIQHGELDPGRFTVVGHSMYRPAVPNTTLANKARNRRVEIIIMPRIYQEEETPRS